MLSIRNLTLDYRLARGALSVLRNLSVDVPPGQVTALIGESGSGKTTLTGAVLGLLAGNAVVRSGEILYGQRDLLRLTSEELRQFRWRQASVVFQAAQGAWNPLLTIGQQMVDSALDHGLPLAQARQRRERLLTQVRLDPRRIAAAYPHQLSGGMRQRALIALSLMLEPELLILDEPTTALDLITQSYIFDILAEIQKERELTMILVTHDLAAVARLADRVAVLFAGTLVEEGPVQQLFETPSHPYSQILLRSTAGESAAGADSSLPIDLRNRPPGCIFAARCPERVPRCLESEPALVNGVACHLRRG